MDFFRNRFMAHIVSHTADLSNLIRSENQCELMNFRSSGSRWRMLMLIKSSENSFFFFSNLVTCMSQSTSKLPETFNLKVTLHFFTKSDQENNEFLFYRRHFIVCAYKRLVSTYLYIYNCLPRQTQTERRTKHRQPNKSDQWQIKTDRLCPWAILRYRNEKTCCFMNHHRGRQHRDVYTIQTATNTHIKAKTCTVFTHTCRAHTNTHSATLPGNVDSVQRCTIISECVVVLTCLSDVRWALLATKSSAMCSRFSCCAYFFN